MFLLADQQNKTFIHPASRALLPAASVPPPAVSLLPPASVLLLPLGKDLCNLESCGRPSVR